MYYLILFYRDSRNRLASKGVNEMTILVHSMLFILTWLALGTGNIIIPKQNNFHRGCKATKKSAQSGK